jgi:NAD-dependent DNA ligase
MNKESLEFTALQKELLEHKYKYYVLNTPTISDYEYDMLERSSFEMAKSLGFSADRFDNPMSDEAHHVHWMVGFDVDSIYKY